MKKLIVVFLLLAGCAGGARVQSGPVDAALRERAKIHAELGSGYYAQNRYGVALDEFKEAIGLDPSYAPAYAGLGLVHAALRQDDQAETNFRRALEIDPGNSESHNNYGTFLCSRNRIDESIAEFMAAVSNPLYSTPAAAYLNAGICALKKHDDQNAANYLQQALRLQPQLPQASYLLADILFARGDLNGASNHLQQAMQHAEPSSEMLWLAVRMARARGDKDAEASYGLLLRKKYPESEQTKAMLAE